MIPLLHDFTGQRVLVVGAGPVGARKARRFTREAEVVVVAPEFGDREWNAQLVRAVVRSDEAGDWLDRVAPALVVAATDDGAVNAALERAARERGVLVNRTDEAGGREPPSVVVPATVRDDPVVVAVGTGGTSPALSRYLRQELATVVDGAGAMADLTADLRAELQKRGVSPARRREAVRAVVGSDAVWKGLDSGTPNPRQTADAVLSDVIDDT